MTLHSSTAIAGETPDTREYTFAVAIMPNLKGHTDSIKNSQFKAAWQSGPTRTIRVPIALADATLEYARQLDRGVEPRDTRKRVEAGAEIPPAVEPRDTSVFWADASELLDAADLLNDLKKNRKKSKMDLADMKSSIALILEKLKKSCDDTSQEN